MADALLFRLRRGPNEPPEFRSVPCGCVQTYRADGWYLLADERSIRQADIEETRQADISVRINRPRWWR
jgi:hypothetical protein